MNTLSVKIPKEVDNALSRLAANRGTSKSNLIREACGQYIVQHEVSPPSTSLLEQMGGEIVGAINGPGDLSTNSDYMEGYGQ